jgi:hypothetical protein
MDMCTLYYERALVCGGKLFHYTNPIQNPITLRLKNFEVLIRFCILKKKTIDQWNVGENNCTRNFKYPLRMVIVKIFLQKYL